MNLMDKVPKVCPWIDPQNGSKLQILLRFTHVKYINILHHACIKMHICFHNIYIYIYTHTCVCVCVIIRVCTQRNDKYVNMHVNIYYET